MVRLSDGPGVIACLLLGRLGDAITALPLLDALRARYPQKTLRLAFSACCRGLEGLLGPADFVWVPRWTSPAGVARAAASLRAPAEAAIELNPAPSKSAAALLALAAAPRKVGFRKRRLNAVFTDQLEEPREDEPMLERYARLAAFLDASPGYEPMPRLRLSDAARAQGVQRARALRGQARRLLLVHPGNFKKFDNRWPEEKFVALLDALAQDEALAAALVAGPGEQAPVAAIAAACRRPPTVVGPDSLERTGALLAAADLFVCNITGTTHLAHGVGAPTFGLYAGYTDAVWRPRRDGCGGVVSSEWRSCRSIPVEQALAAIRRALWEPAKPA